ncbi:MAG: hypothetical protein Q7S64_01380 [bacterium]|nr:hypothetical protein [bacterium]
MEQEPTDSSASFEQVLMNDPATAIKTAREALVTAERARDDAATKLWRERERQAREREISVIPDPDTLKEVPEEEQEKEQERVFAQLLHIYNELAIWRQEEGLLKIDIEVEGVLIKKLAQGYILRGESGHAADIEAEYAERLQDEQAVTKKAA